MRFEQWVYKTVNLTGIMGQAPMESPVLCLPRLSKRQRRRSKVRAKKLARVMKRIDRKYGSQLAEISQEPLG